MIRILRISVLLSSLFLALSSYYVYAQQLPVEWLREFNARGKCSDRIFIIRNLPGGDVVSAGYAGHGNCQPDAFAMKRSAAGDTLWTWYYDGGDKGEDQVNDMDIDNAGNVYLTGFSEANSSSVADCFTAKLDPAGNQLWLTRMPSVINVESRGNGIVTDNSGDVYVCGIIDPLSNSSDWIVAKYNGTNGALLWQDQYNAPASSNEEALDIALSAAGNPTACGFAYDTNVNGGQNVFVRQYNPTGSVLWSDTYSNPAALGAEQATGLRFLPNGDLVVGGSTDNGATNVDALALRYDATGNRLWAVINAYPNDEYINGFAADDSGNVYLTGTEYQNGVLNRINGDGTPGWRKKWIGPVSNGYDVFHDVCTGPDGSIYVTGRGVYPGNDFYGNNGMANQIIVKYNSAGDSLWTYRSADTINPSMGFAIHCLNGIVTAGGFVTDTAYINENFYTQIVDTTGNEISEWKYNGIGDAITRGQVVRTDAGNNVYCAATVDYSIFQYGYDVVLIKYDPAGNLLWERYYSSPSFNNDTLTHMEVDPSGNLVMCISSDSAGLKNNYLLSLVKVDANGNFIDTVTYQPAQSSSILAKSMLMRNDGSVAIGAESNIDGGIILFFDPSGTTLWTQEIDTTQFAVTRVNSIAAFPNGDIAVAGFTQTGAGNTAKGIVQRYSPTGTLLWSADYDSVNVYDDAIDVSVSPADMVAVAGLSGYTTTGTSTLVTYDGANGQLLWRKTYNPNLSNEYGKKVRFTPDGNIAYLCRGWTGFVARYITLQYDVAGNFQWVSMYSPTASDREPVELLIAPDNSVVTAGWWLDGTTTNANYVLVGYNSDGSTQFTNTWANTGATTSNPDYLRSLTRDNAGNYIVTGESALEFFNNFLYRMVTIKYGSSIVGIDETVSSINTKNQITFYPNPSADGIFYPAGENIRAALDGARVFDMRGVMVRLIEGKSGVLDLSGLPSGLYQILPGPESKVRNCYRVIIQ